METLAGKIKIALNTNAFASKLPHIQQSLEALISSMQEKNLPKYLGQIKSLSEDLEVTYKYLLFIEKY